MVRGLRRLLTLLPLLILLALVVRSSVPAAVPGLAVTPAAAVRTVVR
jgi:hypothetical protein